MSQDKLSDHARSVIESNRYMALGTADGRPPVGLARVVRVRGLPQLPLGLLARFEALAELRRPPGGRDRDL